MDYFGGMFGNMRDRTETGWEDVSAIRAVLEKTRGELEQTRKDIASYKAQQDEQRTADQKQAVVDQKKNRRDLYKSTALSVCLTLFLEHIPDIIRLFQHALEFFRSLSH